MFWAIIGIMIVITVVMIKVGEERFNKWFDGFKCPHDYKVRKNYLEAETEVAECKKCGRQLIINNDGE